MKVNIGKYPRGPGQRKISVEIEKFDTWSFDHTLAHIIYPALIQLKEQKMGVPGDFANDVGGENYSEQKSFDFYEESHQWAFEEKCKLWDETLDKMIWSFEQLIKDEYEDQYHHGKGEYDWVESDHTFPNPITGKVEKTYQMVDKNPDEHWFDIEGQQLHEARIQEGFELFGKYFRNLWT
jgi:hypothetical protein